MIYVLNVNPSLDYFLEVSDVKIGETNRSKEEYYKPGGKGTNVSIVLSNVGVETVMYGFVGGFAGTYINDELKKYKYINNKMIHVDHNSRINVKLKGAEMTEINARGSEIKLKDQRELNRLLSLIEPKSIVVISGRLPKGMDESWYLDICEVFHKKSVSIVVDIASPIVKDLCRFKPLLLKPNIDELGLIFGKEIETELGRDFYALELLKLGAKNCIVSMGSKGSVLYNRKESYFAHAIEETVLNTVGAGDSMVAGFLSSYVRNKSIEDCFVMANACAAGSIFSEKLATEESVNKFKERVKITKRNVTVERGG